MVGGLAHTMTVVLGVGLELRDEVVKLFLPLVPAVEALLLELRVVALEELVVGRLDVIDERGAADAAHGASVPATSIVCQHFDRCEPASAIAAELTLLASSTKCPSFLSWPFWRRFSVTSLLQVVRVPDRT